MPARRAAAGRGFTGVNVPGMADPASAAGSRKSACGSVQLLSAGTCLLAASTAHPCRACPASPALPCPARSEGGIWSTLFGLLLWDALFQPLPDVFRTPFQAAPLDLDTPGFYPARQVG